MPANKVDIRFLFGSGVLVLFILLTVSLFYWTSGVFLATHWVAFYVLIALITGFFFWAFTESSGEFSWQEFGLKMGGGAAIGIGFMLLANHLAPPLTSYRVVAVKQPVTSSNVVMMSEKPAAFSALADDPKRVFIEFREAQKEVVFQIRYVEGEQLKSLTYHIPRIGQVPEPTPE